MADKISHNEFCARGGRSRSAIKLEAARQNLEKAKAALSARSAARTQSVAQADNCGRPGNDYPDGSLRACYNFNLVRNYIAQTGRSLEVAVEEARQRMG